MSPVTMMADTFRRNRKYFVVLGAVFIVFTTGTPWYFGNLATYHVSYFHFSPHHQELDTSTLLPVFFIFMTLGTIVSGVIADKIGPIRTISLSVFLMDVAIFLTYFSVLYHNDFLFVVTFMAVPGFVTGAVNSLFYSLVASWFKGGNVGLASSFVCTALSTGGIIYNEMVTAFINPDNRKPDFEDGNMVYFSQLQINERYPSLFIAIGAVSVMCQVIGIPLIKSPPDSSNEVVVGSCETPSNCGRSGTDTAHDVSTTTWNTDRHDVNIIQETNDTRSSYKNIDKICSKPANTFGTFRDVLNNSNTEETIISREEISDIGQVTKLTVEKDMKPLETLKCLRFYVVWLWSLSTALVFLAVNDYYKLFGQLWISDDTFLTLTGTLSIIVSSLMRLAAGFAVDTFGLKTVVIGNISLQTVLVSFWYLSVRVHRVFYALVTASICGFSSNNFLITPLAALKYFGEKHYPVNYGLLMTSTLFVSLIVPVIFPHMLHHFGWLGLLMSIGFLGPVTTSIVCILLP